MMTLTSTPAHALSSAYDRGTADPPPAAASASARATFSLAAPAPAPQAAPPAAAPAAPRPKPAVADDSIPDPVRMMALLSASAGASGTSGAPASTPATLAMMSDIAVASGSGAISDAQRNQLQAQYAQLQAQFGTTVDSASQAQAAADHRRDSDTGDNAQSSDDRRSTLTRDSLTQAPQTVQHDPQYQLVTTTKMVQIGQDSAPPKTPVASVRVHELHVGSDSYEPVAVKQTQTRSTRPAGFAQVEAQTTTHRVAVAQVTQIRQMSQVAQVQQLSVVA
jgi:hypothetical protein